MFAAAGKAEILTGVDDVFFTFVADDALAVKSEDQRVAGSGVLAETRTGVKRHEREFHCFAAGNVHVDDLSVLIGDKLAETENLPNFDCLIH